MNKKAKRNSGGILVVTNKQISQHVSVVQLTNRDYDVFLCCTYISPRSSCRFKGDDVVKLNIIYNDVLTFQERGSILIMGDLNSRVGTQVDYIDEDNETHLELPDYNYVDGSINDVLEQNTNVIKDRISDDVIINDNAKELLQLCRSTNLYILNGRIGPTPEGRCTCQTARGQSVVDYIIASVDLLLLTSGVVGNFLLWERSHGIMVTYPIVIRGGGGGLYLNKWSFMKGKNPCSKMGV